MNRRIRFSFFSLVTLWVLLLSLVMPLAAFADDGVPPPDAGQAPTEEAPVSDTSDGSEVTASESIAPEEALPTQESFATEAEACEVEICPVPTEEAAPAEEPAPTEEPVVQDSTSQETGEELSDETSLEDVTVAEVLEAAPEGTELLVLGENGEVLPLVSEEAVQVVATGDPMWCPDGSLPYGSGCTPPFSTFTGPNGLLTFLHSNPAIYSGSGTIFVDQHYDTYSELWSSIAINYIDGYGMTDLTIQGGWDFGSNTLVGTTTFNKDLQIKWIHSVTLNDLIVEGSNYPFQPANVEITTGVGSISLDNVDAINNASGYGAILNANGSVTINDSGFNDNQSGGLYILSDGDVSLTDLTASNNVLTGVFIQNNNSAGHNVTMDQGTFNGNDYHGLYIVSAGEVSLTDISSVGNGGYGVYVETNGNIMIDPSSFNGNTLDGAALIFPLDANIICSEFKNNGGFGVRAGDVGTTLTLNDVTFSGNARGDINASFGTTVTETGGCPPSNGGGEDDGDGGPFPPSGDNLQVEIIPVTGGANSATLDCALFSGTTLALPNGDSLTFMCPTTGNAGITPINDDDLPGELPEGAEFVTGLEGSLENGDSPPLPGAVVVSFDIPDAMDGEDFTILFWNGSDWEELDGFLTADGYFQAVTDQAGIFVLVTM